MYIHKQAKRKDVFSKALVLFEIRLVVFQKGTDVLKAPVVWSNTY